MDIDKQIGQMLKNTMGAQKCKKGNKKEGKRKENRQEGEGSVREREKKRKMCLFHNYQEDFLEYSCYLEISATAYYMTSFNTFNHKRD